MKRQFLTIFLKTVALLTIGLVSIVLIITKPLENKIFVSSGEVSSSEFGINYQNEDGENFLVAFPLNDYYYIGPSKIHLLNKIEKSDKKDSWKNLFGLGLNQEFEGPNDKTAAKASYEVTSSGNSLTVTRKISADKNFDAIGEGIVICGQCLVVDDKGRIYFNQDFFGEKERVLASNQNLTPVILGPDQFFPQGISKLHVIDNQGKTKLTIPITNEKIYFQESWKLLEIRKDLGPTDKAIIKQTILL